MRGMSQNLGAGCEASMRKKAFEALVLYTVSGIPWFLMMYMGYLETLQAIILTAILHNAYYLGISLAWTRKVWKEDLSALGWTRHGWKRNLFWGLLAFFVNIGVSGLYSTAVARLGLLPKHFPQPDIPTSILIVFAGLISAPIAEETFFRGFVQVKLTKATSAPLGIIISSALFGAGHVVWGVSQVFGTFITALIFGYAFHKTKSIFTTGVAHGLTNFIGLIWRP